MSSVTASRGCNVADGQGSETMPATRANRPPSPSFSVACSAGHGSGGGGRGGTATSGAAKATCCRRLPARLGRQNAARPHDRPESRRGFGCLQAPGRPGRTSGAGVDLHPLPRVARARCRAVRAARVDRHAEMTATKHSASLRCFVMGPPKVLLVLVWATRGSSSAADPRSGPLARKKCSSRTAVGWRLLLAE